MKNHTQQRIAILMVALIVSFLPLASNAATLASPLSPAFKNYLKQLSAKASQIAVRYRVVKPVYFNGTCPILQSNLSFGMRGSDVEALQNFLISQNTLPSDSATGYYGALTQGAVQTFQTLHTVTSGGTPATTGFGAVGPKTRDTILSLCGATNSISKQSTSIANANNSSSQTPQQTTSTQTPATPSSSVSQTNSTSGSTSNTSTNTSNTSSNTSSNSSANTDNSSDNETTLPSSYEVCGTINTADIQGDQGFSYRVQNFVGGGDTTANPQQSNLALYENGFLIGPPDSALQDIRSGGDGSYLHSSEGGVNNLYFSASDNTDPRSNGYVYTYGVSQGTCDTAAGPMSSQMAAVMTVLQSLVPKIQALITTAH